MKQITPLKRWLLNNITCSVLRRLRATVPPRPVRQQKLFVCWAQHFCAGAFLLHAVASHPRKKQHPGPRVDNVKGVSRAAEHTGRFGVFQTVSKCGSVKNGKIFMCDLVFLLQLTEPRWHWSRKWNKYMQEVFSQSYLIHQKGHLNKQQHLIYIELLFMHPVNIRSNF